MVFVSLIFSNLSPPPPSLTRIDRKRLNSGVEDTIHSLLKWRVNYFNFTTKRTVFYLCDSMSADKRSFQVYWSPGTKITH